MDLFTHFSMLLYDREVKAAPPNIEPTVRSTVSERSSCGDSLAGVGGNICTRVTVGGTGSTLHCASF
eukprot:1874829-Pyramimonas_sp.AAC.1